MGRFSKHQDGARKHEEEKYEFIKEQIRPQRKQHLIRFANKVLEFIMLALVFGSVAGIVFWNVNNELSSGASTAQRDIANMPPETQAYGQDNRETANTYTPPELDKEGVSKDDLAAIEEQNRVSKKLSAVGNRLSSSVVHIINYKSKEMWYEDDNSRQVVSGVVFKATARYYYIIASKNFSGTDVATIEFDDGEVVDADFIASNPDLGLSVFSVIKSAVSTKRRNQIVIPEFGSTVSLPAGSNVIAAGAPNGVMYSVMTGNVIKTGITMPVIDNVISLYATDILYTEGSNGIVLNTKGRIIGFITDSYKNVTGRSNLGFIGVSGITDLIGNMVSGKTTPYFGIEGYDVDKDTAAAHKIEEGVYVTSVYIGSPAYTGGMRTADVITQIDGREISSLTMLHNILKAHKEEDTITVTISRKTARKNNIKKLSIVLG